MTLLAALLLASPSLGGAPFANGLFRPPYAALSFINNTTFVSYRGCHVGNVTFSVPPSANSSNGRVELAYNVSAGYCSTAKNSISIQETTVQGFLGPNFTPKASRLFTITYNWSLSYYIRGFNSGPAYPVDSGGVFIVGNVFDATNGSWLIGSGLSSGSHRAAFGGVSNFTRAAKDQTFKLILAIHLARGHRYQLGTELESSDAAKGGGCIRSCRPTSSWVDLELTRGKSWTRLVSESLS